MGWFGLLAPAATPAPVVARLSADANQVLRDNDVVQRMLAFGAEPSADTPAQFAAFIRDDQAKWSKLMHERGIVPEQ